MRFVLVFCVAVGVVVDVVLVSVGVVAGVAAADAIIVVAVGAFASCDIVTNVDGVVIVVDGFVGYARGVRAVGDNAVVDVDVGFAVIINGVAIVVAVVCVAVTIRVFFFLFALFMRIVGCVVYVVGGVAVCIHADAGVGYVGGYVVCYDCVVGIVVVYVVIVIYVVG